jgi:hypothetical protein
VFVFLFFFFFFFLFFWGGGGGPGKNLKNNMVAAGCQYVGFSVKITVGPQNLLTQQSVIHYLTPLFLYLQGIFLLRGSQTSSLLIFCPTLFL